MTFPKQYRQRLLTAPIALALSLSISSAALAAPGDTNSTNNGANISGGSYYNTNGNKTTFINNRGADGLNLGAGQTVRGLEVNGAGNPNGNGGTLHFYAPGSIVRLNGNVDVSGILNGSGAYTGNGGRVFVDSAFLFQNGTIFANGLNGGAIQFNVGSAMFGPSSRVEARGFGGLGGTISVNGIGTVDLQNGAIFDASGKGIRSNTLSDNVNINIVASLVNNNGIIRANAVNVGNDGHVSLLGSNPALAAAEAIDAARSVVVPNPTPAGDMTANGGVIRLVSNGQTRSDCVDCAADKGVAEGILSQVEASDIKTRNADLVAGNEGNVVNTGLIQANGADNTNTNPANGLNGGNGGKVIIASAADTNNTGTIEAKGGRGANYFSITNLTQQPGDGGAGGTVAISALGNINNSANATIDASGGAGGDSSTDPVNPNAGYSLVLTNTSNTNRNPVTNAIVTPTDAQQFSIGAANAETVVPGGIRAGSGGNGGVVALSYGKTLNNDGTVSANGGAGGRGLDVSIDALADGGVRQEAQSIALAVGGAGGFGGNGGIIALSGPDNPTGTGLYQANGGKGGNGGDANARASALAIGSGDNGFEENSLASAIAFGGQGGAGGDAGLVLTPNPGTATLNYSTRNGAGGDAGLATSEARSLAVDAGFAQAFSQGRVGSSAYALGTTINIPNANPITDFSFGSPAANTRQAFQTRAIFGLDRAGTETLVAPFGTLGLGSSEAIFRTAPLQVSADGLMPVLSGVTPGPGNTPAIDFADATANVNVIGSTPIGANTALGQTQNTEIIVNGNTAVLLAKGGPQNTITDRIGDAFSTGSVRSLNNPDEAPIRHLLVSDVSGNALTLDNPVEGFNGLTSLTVNHLGSVQQTEGGTTTNDLVIPTGTQWTVGFAPESGNLSSGGGHASLTSGTNVITFGSGGIQSFGTNTGGSIALTGANVFLVNDDSSSFTTLQTNTNDNAFHGGAISLKGAGAVWHDTGINDDADLAIIADGNALGGTVRLQAGVLLANNGLIQSNGGLQGGSIIGKSGLVALNQQTLNANGGVNGGFVRWHGNALAINGPDIPGSQNPIGYPGDINASGGVNGGVIKLTSGGPVPDGYTNDESSLLTNLLTNQSGFGITQGTLLPGGTANLSLVTALPNTLPNGSAINAGNMNTLGSDGDAGAVDIAGDALAFGTANSTINGVTNGTNPVAFFADAANAGTRFIAGPGAVLAAACGGILPLNPLTPVSNPPDSGVQPFTPLFNAPEPPVNAQDFTGLLFQNQRPYLLDRLPVPTNNKIILRLGQPGLFLARAYAPVTQEILNLSLEEYNRELSNGKTIAEALRITQLYLQQAGVDNEIASQLVEQIAAGAYQADKRVVTALKTIAAANIPQQQQAAPAGEPLRQ